MKIVVCIKQVPDTTEIKLDPVTGTMIIAVSYTHLTLPTT